MHEYIKEKHIKSNVFNLHHWIGIPNNHKAVTRLTAIKKLPNWENEC